MKKMELVFQMKFSERILHRYLVYTKDLAKDQYVLMMPVFTNCTLKTSQDWQFFNEIVRENLRLQTGAFPHLFCRVFLLLISVIWKSDLTEHHFIMLFALLMSEGLTVITRFLWPPSS